MAALRHEHTAARREALQLLYTGELMGLPLDQVADGSETELLLVPECPQGVSDADLVGVDLVAYASTLVNGIAGHIDELDERIGSTAENWTLERMPIVDRNIIRIATYEILHCDEIPTGVAINEAVELAKAFGTDESPKFVNGVLGRIASEVCGEDAAQLDANALEPQASIDEV